ncbi:hypothetical protein A9404_09620 [Halothiobacillus diazotrophicus]|uniref:Nucleotidyl transferase domain-containing protein n=1 Tax=Halothiobacillus diazotrophicus TaxID=1860122 RepID=A0A191ZKN1_9GAMM|nr:hypothetical protein A9404_09620 [Halothiobacillus diazotrophicus]
MRAMILAAGRGERMRPLTDHTPKPLLPVQGKPLIVHHIERLVHCGIQDIVINLNHLAEQIPAVLGDGETWGVRLHYSWENQCPESLETAGGIRHALSLLSEEFLLVNGDVLTDFPFDTLLTTPLPPTDVFRLALVDNPPHHPRGDFGLSEQGRLTPCANTAGSGSVCLTYAGIGRYRRNLFAPLPEGRRPLGPLLHDEIAKDRGSGLHHPGVWLDVGTVERLNEAQATNLQPG